MNDNDRKQAEALVAKVLGAGLSVSVNDGEEWVAKRSRDPAVILAAMGSTDMDGLRFRDADNQYVGFAMLVYGNGPDELVADCSAEGIIPKLLGLD